LRLVVRFSPLIISTTCSVGMRISPKSSVMFSRRMRSSSDFLALFSKPEYVWTTYHFFSRFGSALGSVSAMGPFHSLRCR